MRSVASSAYAVGSDDCGCAYHNCYTMTDDGEQKQKLTRLFYVTENREGENRKKNSDTARGDIIDVSIATAAIWHSVDKLFYNDPSVFSARPYPQHRSGEIDYPWNSGYADQRGGGGVRERRKFARQSNNLPPTIRGKRERNISISAIIDLLLHHIQRRIDCSQLALS